MKKWYIWLLMLILVFTTSGCSCLTRLSYKLDGSHLQKLKFKPGILRDLIIAKFPDMTIHYTLEPKISPEQIKNIDTWLTNFYKYICDNATIEMEENKGKIQPELMGMSKSNLKTEQYVVIQSMEELNKVLQTITDNQIVSYYISKSVFYSYKSSNPVFTLVVENKNHVLSLTVKDYEITSHAIGGG